MKKYFLSVVVSICIAGGVIPSGAASLAPVGSPTRAIQDLDGMLDDFKNGGNLSDVDRSFNEELKRKIIRGTFDIRELSRLALAKHWDAKSEAERNHFVDVMVTLLEEKALFSREQSAKKSKEGGKYRVVYRGEKFLNESKTKAMVKTVVLVPSENIDVKLNYSLTKNGSEWKIYDVIVDEASLMQNYRYQFNTIITKYGYEDLIARMTKKLNEIREKRSKQ